MCSEEARFIADHSDRIRTFLASDLHRDGADCMAELAQRLAGQRVLLSIDVDGLDPSVVPTTGTPEPGGLSWSQVGQILRTVCGAAGQVVALDCTELAPRPHLHAADFTVAKLVYKAITHALLPVGGES